MSLGQMAICALYRTARFGETSPAITRESKFTCGLTLQKPYINMPLGVNISLILDVVHRFVVAG